MIIDDNPKTRPETAYHQLPTTAEEKLAIYEDLLAQHGLVVEPVKQVNGMVWFALLPSTTRIVREVRDE